ncbi:AcrR family transcriptional regulator [Allocatelliglobosispora scoriae]|uniref:AcrR family transcriptional regulator n=1 Tax=Allocatelliglobosispora scoriae TaxID=643052 RepID=A0A841BIE1_9ACTN|nr:TetR/AcrR family transcriptional regulator [Allocatelliglobosispora scoriae]MBB5868034.1 AcrR family transcriptional regulator [Allocatelliglobosispora scoriae]
MVTSMGERRRRVPSMAPDDRRAALIAATLPLLREHGLEVSTRQIAEAAGVAEGTIFRVFPDKQALICAALGSAFDPMPSVAALRGMDLSLDLRQRLTLAAEILTERVSENGRLVGALRAAGPMPGLPPGPPSFLRDSFVATIAALTFIIEPDRHQLRRSPDFAAKLFFTLILTSQRGGFHDSELLDSDEIVTALLDGLLARPASTYPADSAKETAC